MIFYSQISTERLAENNQLNSNHVLIFDEPENHLHPEWQLLLLARLLVDLVNQHKVYVLVNSHSPYMIETLKIYDINLKEKTHFYLNQLTDMGIEVNEVNEVTNDLSSVFEKLSLPFQKLEQTAL